MLPLHSSSVSTGLGLDGNGNGNDDERSLKYRRRRPFINSVRVYLRNNNGLYLLKGEKLEHTYFRKRYVTVNLGYVTLEKDIIS